MTLNNINYKLNKDGIFQSSDKENKKVLILLE